MGYDEVIANRIRELLADDPTVTEKRMFGGLAFLVNGHMAVAASSAKGALIRVDPDLLERFVATTAAVPMVMQGRPMAGWLAVPPSELITKRDVARWVRIGVTYTRSLSAKVPPAPPI